MSDDPPATETDGSLGSLGSLLGAIASTRQSPALAAGTLVGEQYEIVKPLGQGGMGVVYLARDRKLDRDVAIKVGFAMSAEALASAEREARTLAKLAHPNVVVVHQVGAIDGRIFIAMEYIPRTAREWLGAAERTWPEIVTLFASVGDGLAAAHAAGLVHRDFKPENVLVGADERPRISDFGVAATSGELETGRVVGTVAYMPPEQLAGDNVDAHADQYAFAVSLWEALFGERPSSDPLPPARNPRGVPRTVIASLRRALAKDPSARWESTRALVAALRSALDRRRSRWIVASGATLVLGAGSAIAAMQLVRDDTPSCDTGAAAIASVWSPSRRAQLATDGPLVAFIDARTESWAATHDAACKATHVERTASSEILDRRMLCLATVKSDLDAALTLASESREAAAQLVPFLEARTAPASCLDVARLGDEEPPPPEARATLEAAERALSEATAAALDRAVADPLGKTERAVAAARATTWRPLIARALNERGAVLLDHDRLSEASTVLDEAARLAIAARADETALYAYIRGAWALGDQGRAAEAQQLVATARSLWERLGKPPDLGWSLYTVIGQLAHERGQKAEALEATRIQMALGRAAFGSAATFAQDNYNVALMLLESGRFAEAAETNATAIRYYQDSLGPDHPNVGKALVQKAAIAWRRGQMQDAIADASAGLAILERRFGPDDARLANGLMVLGDAHRWIGKAEVGRGHLERALGIMRKTEPGSRQIPFIEQNLALIAYARGDLAEARTRGVAALAAAEVILGAEHVELIDYLALLAAIDREGPAPDLERSDQQLVRAQRLASASLPAGHRRIVNLAIERSYTQVKANQARAAIAALSPYAAQIDSLELGVLTPHELRFALAQAFAADGSLAKACSLAKAAQDGYVAAKSPASKQVAAFRDVNCRSR